MQQNKHSEYQVYLEEREQLIDAERETVQQFDKAILTLADGALALSITFINQIAPHPKSHSKWFLLIAWILFCLSLLSTLISFLASQVACRRQREILDKRWFMKDKDKSMSDKNHADKNNAAILTNKLNYVSIAFFIFGIIFLIIFSTINLPITERRVKVMSRKEEEAGYVPPKLPTKPIDNTEKGYVPPKPPVKPPPNKK